MTGQGVDDEETSACLRQARHRLARRIFFGQRGELRRHYRKGMEDQRFFCPAKAGRRPLHQPSADENAGEA
ncbi:hypothetical protein ACWEWG_40735 [Streptomyces sp. NPDC003758]|uniref:Transposase n=1 Tax=Streptomyces cynarae TaxID=2981134 RepID=A0ABY6DT18_9ACTN|nr:transposase [Streptomyces cynarae]UXY17506.1 transposase [Streptomyces cynarae]